MSKRPEPGKLKAMYGSDPRELPLYSLADTSRYLKINLRTLASWVHGRRYTLDDGSSKFWSPVINLPEPAKPLLSFYNLVEVHVLLAIRRIHNVQFRKVRSALDYLETQFNVAHPLATEDFWTDKFDLFVRKSGDLICASKHGQQVIEEAVKQYLHRIERDIDLTPFRLYPFSREITFRTNNFKDNRRKLESMPKHILIDPLVAFGRPTLAETGVATNVIAGRFKAGEPLRTIARDYDVTEAQVKEALKYEDVVLRAA